MKLIAYRDSTEAILAAKPAGARLMQVDSSLASNLKGAEVGWVLMDGLTDLYDYKGELYRLRVICHREPKGEGDRGHYQMIVFRPEEADG